MEVTDVVFEAGVETSKGMIFINFMLKYALKFSMNSIFSMIDFLQLIVYLPCINYNFPANAQLVFGHLVEISTFEMFETDDWVP